MPKFQFKKFVNAHYTGGRRQQKSVRIPRVCLVPGCRSKPQKKLSQHLRYKHPHLDEGD